MGAIKANNKLVKLIGKNLRGGNQFSALEEAFF